MCSPTACGMQVMQVCNIHASTQLQMGLEDSSRHVDLRHCHGAPSVSKNKTCTLGVDPASVFCGRCAGQAVQHAWTCMFMTGLLAASCVMIYAASEPAYLDWNIRRMHAIWKCSSFGLLGVSKQPTPLRELTTQATLVVET